MRVKDIREELDLYPDDMEIEIHAFFPSQKKIIAFTKINVCHFTCDNCNEQTVTLGVVKDEESRVFSAE